MYRTMLSEILANSNGKHILSCAEVSRMIGKTRPWCKERLGIGKCGITAEALAWKLSTDFV